MSLHEEWASSILEGRKRVELRRRRPHFPPGTIVWMYATAPRKAVIGWFEVGLILEVDAAAPPPAILAAAGETAEGLAPYLAGLRSGYGIEVRRHGGMREEVPVPGNRGPMSYRILYPDRDTDSALLDRLRRNAIGL
jgi:predicted transcriptional regulator